MYKKFFLLISIFIIFQNICLAQINLNGRMEVILIDAGNGTPLTNDSENVINHGYPAFLWQLRLYMDMPVSERSAIFSDFRIESDGLKIEFAVIRLFLNKSQTLTIEAGVLGTAIGNVTARRSSKYNPLIHLPIIYEYHTTLPSNRILTINEILVNRGSGTGLRILNQGVYRPGVELSGTWWDKLDFNLGVFNSSPSNPYMTNYSNQFNYTQRIGIRPFMGLNLGLSISKGPYLDEYVADNQKLMQTIYDFDFSFERGHLSFFGEAAYNQWDTPVTDDPFNVFGYYLELKYKFLPHYFVTTRWGQLIFDNHSFFQAGKFRWDDNVQRFEIGLGYYVLRETLAKLVYQRNITERIDPEDDYIAVQLSAGF